MSSVRAVDYISIEQAMNPTSFALEDLTNAIQAVAVELGLSDEQLSPDDAYLSCEFVPYGVR